MSESVDTYRVNFETGDSGMGEMLDKLTAQFVELQKQLAATTAETKKYDEASGTAAGATDKQAAGTSKLAGGLKDGLVGGLKIAAVGLGAMTAALAGAAAGVIMLSKAGSEQQKVDAQLMAGIKSTGATAEEAAERYKNLTGVVGGAVVGMGAIFGDEVLTAGLGDFVRMTGKAEAGAEDLDRIMKISLATGKDIQASAKVAAAVQKGDMAALVKLTALTKEQAAALTKIKDPTERAAAANAILDKTLQGVDVRTQTAQGAIARFGNVSGDLTQELGKVINESGGLTVVMDLLAVAGEKVVAFVAENSVQLQHMANVIARYVISALHSLGSILLDVVWSIKDFGLNLEAVGFVAKLAAGTILGVFAKLQELMTKIFLGLVNTVSGAFDSIVSSAISVATALRQTGLVETLTKAKDGIAEISDAINKSQNESSDANTAYAQGLKDQAMAEAKLWVARKDQSEAGKAALQKVLDGMLTDASKALTDAENKVGKAKTGPDPVNLNVDSLGGGGVEDKKKKKEKVETLELDRQILELESRLLDAKKEGNILMAGELNYAKELLEGQRARVAVKDQETARLMQEISLKQAEALREAAEQEQVREWADEAEKRHTNVLKRIADETKARNDAAKKEAVALKSANAAQAQAQAFAARSASQVAALVIKDQRKLAMFEGLMQVAQGVAQFASYAASGFTNVAALTASVQHGLAGAKFFAAAGSSGGGSGGQGGGGGGGSSSGSSSGSGSTAPTVDLRQTQADAAKAIADAIVEANQAQAQRTVEINFYNPTLLGDAPETQRMLANQLAPELENAMNRRRS